MGRKKGKLEKKIEFYYRYRIRFILPFIRNIFSKTGGRGRAILFWPELPHRRSMVYRICRFLGVKIVSGPSQGRDLTFFWEDKTFSEADPAVLGDGKVHNGRCTDISKEKVALVFGRVFGYDLGVDPTREKGRCLAKSNENARHDGRIIECPIEQKEPGMVYEKIIDNHHSARFVMDIRVPVIGRSVPCVYFKFKPVDVRFTNDIARVEVHAAKAVLSSDEIDRILEFCDAMGLDYGELDVLRDKGDGKIYIVDVNKTPWGPPRSISRASAEYVIRRMSRCLENEFARPG